MGCLFEILGIEVHFEVSASPLHDVEQDWQDFTGYLHKSSTVVVDRGRSSERDDIRAGTLTAVLDGTNLDLDPNHPGSPISDCLKPRRRCRLQVLHEGTMHPVFEGYTHGYPRTYQQPNLQVLVPFQATDGFRVLQNIDPTTGLFRFNDTNFGRFDIGRFGGELALDQPSGSFVNANLDAAAWPAAMRDIDPGRVVVDGDLESGRVLNSITNAADAEGGVFFFDRTGWAVFRDRLADYTKDRSTAAQASFSPRPENPPAYAGPLDIAYDDTRLINQARYTGASGDPQIVSDAASIHDYGVGEDSRTLISRRDTDALSLAILRVAQDAQPRDRIETLAVDAHINPPVALPAVLDRELFDLIDFQLEPPGAVPMTVEALVQGIRHEFGSDSWTTTFRLGPRPTVRPSGDGDPAEQFFTFDHATLGQFDGVGVFAP